MNDGKHSGWRHIVALAAMVALCSPAVAQGLSDGPAGMTCHYFAIDGKMSWTQQGGDWVDRDGTLHGSKAHTATSVPAAAGMPVTLDVGGVLSGDAVSPKGGGQLALLLRKPGGRGIVAFHAREAADTLSRPSLALRLRSGATRTLTPVADTFLDCSTRKSLGGSEQLKLSDVQNVLLVFDLGQISRGDILEANLTLIAARLWGRADGQIEVFRAVLPGQADASPAAAAASGLADKFPGDRGLQDDPAVLFAARFEGSEPNEGWTTFGRKSLVELVAAPNPQGFRPLQGQALQVKLLPKQNLGLDLRFDFMKALGAEPEEAYLRYYLMLGKDFVPDVDGGKLPGLAGTYNKAGWGMRPADGSNGWSIRGGFAKSGAATAGKPTVSIGSYAYHADADGPSGQFWGWNLGPTGRLENGRWYAIEQYVRMNTPGRRDGVFRAWIDGVLAFERTDLRFRDIDAIRIENAWFDVYHGGTAKPPREMSLYIDNVVIAREYIGPMRQR